MLKLIPASLNTWQACRPACSGELMLLRESATVLTIGRHACSAERVRLSGCASDSRQGAAATVEAGYATASK